jgi:hypothetical protein
MVNFIVFNHLFHRFLDVFYVFRRVLWSFLKYKKEGWHERLKGQSHEKVCEIMTLDGRIGLN